MSRVIEFLLGSLLIAAFTVASIFFFALHYLLKAGGFEDCAWQGAARTWIDWNGDGHLDDGEPPLAEVGVHVDGVQSQRLNVSWSATTDRDGDAHWNVSIPGCTDSVFEIHVDIPEGYRLTTTPRLEVRPTLWAGPGGERVYYFGFESAR